MSSFHVDGRVSIKLEYDLAMRLGEFILSSDTEDKQFRALGHKLLNIDEDDATPSISRHIQKEGREWESWESFKNKQQPFQQEKEIIRSTGKVLSDFHQKEAQEVNAPAINAPIKIRKSNKYYKSI